MNKIIFISLLILNSGSTVFSQITAYWIGGRNGNSKSWNISSNWSNHRVPNEFTDVIIPYKESCLNSIPEISNNKVKIHSLSIHNGAGLKILKNGSLTIRQNSAQKLTLKNILLEGSLFLPFSQHESISGYFN
ncbi:MAG: hypothetical protein IT267_01495 [Saprospiraceae bacterium]|nr:hypothetical protein [Saprospiraceae bacterium]